jgi:Zn-finger domain-containing protein
MYDKDKLAEAMVLICKSANMIDSLNIEEEPLSYTEPLNRIIMSLDDAIEDIKELQIIMKKEA